jgi:4Fe-4S binding domain
VSSSKKKAARYIDGWLRGRDYEPPPKHELASFDKLNTWYYSDAEDRAAEAGGSPPARDVRGGGRGARRVQRAVRGAPLPVVRDLLLLRQLLRVCPDNAVVKLGDPGELYEIDYDYCKGCGVCVAECPSGAIEMVPEDI